MWTFFVDKLLVDKSCGLCRDYTCEKYSVISVYKLVDSLVDKLLVDISCGLTDIYTCEIYSVNRATNLWTIVDKPFVDKFCEICRDLHW